MMVRRRREWAGGLSRRLLTALSLVTVCATSGATRVLAARTPGWARPIVEEAPPLPEGVTPHHERILLLETMESVQEDGEVRIRRRYASQALRGDTSRLEVGWFHFDDTTTRVSSNRAWHLPPGRGAKKSRQAPVDIAIGSEFLSDSRVRALPVKGVEKGSIVLFEFEAVETPWIMPRTATFGGSAPSLLERYVLEVPEGWTIDWDWIRGEGPDPVISEGAHTWEIRDLEPLPEERMGPSLGDQRRILAINIIPPGGARVGPVALRDWGAFSSWYASLIEGRQAPDSAIESAAAEQTGSHGEDALARIGAAGKYVRDRVRYVAIELGLGGLVPRSAGETHSNLYGDCKDKGTLFRSLLSAGGIESYPLLVNLSYDATLSERIPAWGFDHFLVAVPLPAERPVPDFLSHAIVEAGDLGRLLVVDTTDERTSVGFISASLSGKRALLVSEDGGRLVTLPGRRAADHRIERRLTGELTETGYVRIERFSSYYGEPARYGRQGYGTSAADRRTGVEREILSVWPEASIDGYEVTYEDDEGAYVETVGIKMRFRPPAGETRRLEIFPGAKGEFQRTSLGRRVGPVVYAFPRAVSFQVRYAGIPEGTEVPPAVEESGEGWSVRSDYRLGPGGFEAEGQMVLEKTRFEPDEFASLREFWSAVTRLSSSSLAIPG